VRAALPLVGGMVAELPAPPLDTTGILLSLMVAYGRRSCFSTGSMGCSCCTCCCSAFRKCFSSILKMQGANCQGREGEKDERRERERWCTGLRVQCESQRVLLKEELREASRAEDLYTFAEPK